MSKIFTVRFKKDNTGPEKWARMQGNLSDAITYLIEKEIAENGFRDLQEHIPVKRSPVYFKKVLENYNAPEKPEPENNDNDLHEDKQNSASDEEIPSCYTD